MTIAEQATDRFLAGWPVLVAGLDGSRAAVALAAERIDRARLEQLDELSSDMVVLGVEEAIAERLDLAVPPRSTRIRPGLELAIPFDAVGLRGARSLSGRARTIRQAVHPDTRPRDLTVPGHVHAGRIHEGGGSAEGVALELARAAGLPGATVLTSVLDRAGRALSLTQARLDPRIAALPIAPIDELCARALARAPGEELARCALPTRAGPFSILAAQAGEAGALAVTLVHGEPWTRQHPIIHRHTACLLGDTFGSLLCDCGERLERATEEILHAGAGILVYLKPDGADPFACPARDAA